MDTSNKTKLALARLLGFSDELRKIAMGLPKPTGLSQVKQVITPKIGKPSYSKIQKQPEPAGGATGTMSSSNTMSPPPVTGGPI